jgi:rhamnogalacturonyl hydrolase YesR
MKQIFLVGFLVMFITTAASSLTSAATANSKESADPQNLDRSSILRVMNRGADWQLAHPEGDPGDWKNAVFYIGLMAAYQTTGSERYLGELEKVGQRLEWQPGERYRHADDHAIAQTYLALYEQRGEPEMMIPFRETINRMMAMPPNWEEIHQPIDYWWSDSLFMSPPALAGLAKATGEVRYLDFMDELWRQSHELLWDLNAQLFYRDTRYRYEEPGIFWSRGNAWVLSGLALMLEEMPEGRSARSFYLDVFRQMARQVAAIQPEDGLWRSNLLEKRRSVPGETSGTALFCHALAWGVRTGVLDRQRYLPVAKNAWSGLVRSVDENGRLGWVQKPGASPARGKKRHSAPYGTGAFLLAGAEMAKLAAE